VRPQFRIDVAAVHLQCSHRVRTRRVEAARLVIGAAVADVERLPVGGERQSVGFVERRRHQRVLAGARVVAVHAVRDGRLWPEALVPPVGRVGEPDRAVRVARDVVGRIERPTVERGDDGLTHAGERVQPADPCRSVRTTLLADEQPTGAVRAHAVRGVGVGGDGVHPAGADRPGQFMQRELVERQAVDTHLRDAVRPVPGH
jgi:hypothetical protein